MINGKESNIFQINKVQKFAEQNNIYAYLIHISLDSITNIYEYNRIDVTIKDSETGELGEGTTYWKRHLRERFNYSEEKRAEIHPQ